ncbi:hypothetical protein R3P38DRAFT_2790437 [Favolaschia claudopus]|uniref:Uncharacterized protein n=1 Tax=Favolaschia claudopus TaxID=2862362 RepID=A0AAW0AJZ3_9AGAR
MTSTTHPEWKWKPQGGKRKRNDPVTDPRTAVCIVDQRGGWVTRNISREEEESRPPTKRRVIEKQRGMVEAKLGANAKPRTDNARETVPPSSTEHQDSEADKENAAKGMRRSARVRDAKAEETKKKALEEEALKKQVEEVAPKRGRGRPRKRP